MRLAEHLSLSVRRLLLVHTNIRLCHITNILTASGRFSYFVGPLFTSILLLRPFLFRSTTFPFYFVVQRFLGNHWYFEVFYGTQKTLYREVETKEAFEVNVIR